MARRLLSVEATAALALAYRELNEPNDCIGDVSLLGKAITELLTETDDLLLEAKEHPDVLPALLGELATVAPGRVEAFLHAFPSSERSLKAVWVERFRGRWEVVERAMEHLEWVGITTRPSLTSAIAEAVLAHA